MTLSLRPAAASDIEAIALVWYRGWFDGHLGHVPDSLLPFRRLADFRRRVPSRLPGTTVAVLDARVAGFLTVHEDEIEQVYVAEKARGGGVADALLRHGERAIAGRFDAAWLAVVAGNTRACRFYLRHGWQDAGSIEYPAEAGRGHIAVTARRYEKRLSRPRPI